jgi:glycosyltransferase involved in cell wall biosynthesis
MSERTILALLPFLVRGALCLRVLRAMRARGLDVAVAFTYGAGSNAPDDAEDFRATSRLIDLSRSHPGDDGAALEEEVRARNVGLVLQIGAPSLYGRLPYIKERFPRVRIVDTLYNDVGHVVNHFLYERCLDGVIVESHHMRRYVERCSCFSASHVELVESGIDIDEFTPAAERSSARSLVVGYVGRMSPEKNPLGFIELCERAHVALPATSFRMVGVGPMAEEVRGRVEASSARAVLSYDGYQADLVSALRALDVLVVPSKVDGRPNVIMEANACGVPVIAAPVGGIPELVEEGRNGCLVGSSDAKRSVEILRTWTSHPELLAEIKASSRSVAEERFDQHRMMDRYEAVFRRHLEMSRS